MRSLRFVWDAKKAQSNIKKHGISFTEATTVFYDENAKEFYDWDHSHTEERYLMLGISEHVRLLLVCYTYREDETLIRIISARRAAKNEAKSYKGE